MNQVSKEIAVGDKWCLLKVVSPARLELWLDHCLRKTAESDSEPILYVWTNVELNWEEHRFVEATFNKSTSTLTVKINREIVLEQTV